MAEATEVSTDEEWARQMKNVTTQSYDSWCRRHNRESSQLGSSVMSHIRDNFICAIIITDNSARTEINRNLKKDVV